ncbi:MAG: hypothetical protein JNN17_26690 [Verrucomicrobiaceae bacterium]|nr:hypothetical protein [Verrucomicrobiaceae bacterium]
MSELLKDNPFAVQSPDDISAGDAHDLFVDVFTDFDKLPLVGHTFIHGPRGSGKSMMFRYMQADCQSIAKGRPVHELPYFAAYVPIKNMQTNFTELKRLEGHAANFVINEHVLSIYIVEKLLDALRTGKIEFDYASTTVEQAQEVFTNSFCKPLAQCRWKGDNHIDKIDSVPSLFRVMHEVALKLVQELNAFLKILSMNQAAVEDYDGPLCGYHDFILPLFRGLRTLPCFPQAPFFLLIDDADNLNVAQTQLLNAWIGTRTHSEVSLKVSTQLRYKTYLTHTGRSIDSPHDFSEIQISTIYTSSHRRYFDRVKAIVEKRLRKAGITTSTEEFFPEDQNQVEEIATIAERIRADWDRGEGRGARSRDDVTRYSRPEFIRSLGGNRKSTSTYSYSGFNQLVSLSSGVVRCFLEPASHMYSEQKATIGTAGTVKCIEPAIQNQKAREFALKFLHADIEKLKRDFVTQGEERLSTLDKLENLLHALGGTFAGLLDSDRAERRVFSIAFSDKLDKEVSETLRLGVEEGYFHESTIGNKEGTGRTKLFVLNRVLAPCFNLDPTSFAGYLFVTNERVKQAMRSPSSYLRDLEKVGHRNFFDSEQLELL